MPSIESFASLREELSRRDRLKSEAAAAAKYIERCKEVRSLRERLLDAGARLGVLRAHRVEIGQLRDTAPVVRSLRTYLAKLIESAAESGRDHGVAKKVLDGYVQQLERAAKNSLDSVISDLPSVNESFLRQVEQNPTYTRQVAAIRAARDQLRREAEAASSGSKQLESFLGRLDELRRLTDQLKPDDFPQEVLDFFKAARHGGAVLEKFTDTVRDWLQRRGELDRVRVIIVN